MNDCLAPLVRRGRRNARYTAISNDIIDHPVLSPEARIVLIYLLSKPDNWRLQIGDMRRLLGAGDKVCGRNKAYEVVKELKDSAYVIAYEELRNGRFHQLTYYVFDEPHTDPDKFKKALRDGAIFGVPPERDQERPIASAPDLPRPEIREAEVLPCPEIPDPENRHINKERNKQNTDIPLSPPIRAKRNDSGKAGKKSDFEKIWNAWPEADRPKKRSYVESLFRRLTPADRDRAAAFASRYRMVEVRRGGFPVMILYLRDQLFAQFDGAPEIDREGYFRITPDREEWVAWIEHLRKHYGEASAAKTQERGFFLPRSRWPEPRDKASAGNTNTTFR